METAGELHRAKARLEARHQYNKGQSVKNWTKKILYWKKWKFDLGNVCAEPCTVIDFSCGRDKITSGLRTVIKTVGLSGSRYFRVLNSDAITHIKNLPGL